MSGYLAAEGILYIDRGSRESMKPMIISEDELQIILKQALIGHRICRVWPIKRNGDFVV